VKVLDLQCARQHQFEGWFASEDDYQDQHQRGLLSCPVCHDVSITKMLSAPRLNLGHSQGEGSTRQEVVANASPATPLQTAWMAVARHLLATTEDVGNQFAEEARKIHYGEGKERGIRGQATREEAESLLDEGIAVVPLSLPEGPTGLLQ
jgi:hypothetical protein